MADEAFEALWRSHFRAVVRTAYLVTGDVQEAQDVTQEAFTRALERWRRVATLDRPEAWVHKVATNLAISHRRKKRPPGLPSSEAVPPPDPPDDALLRALKDLTPQQRAVIVLRFYLDWSVDEVAQALGKRPGTVTALTHQGLSRLRATVSRELSDG
jgi:RNA polymerase sigma-70 factor (sigma-E family)